jgi:monovalent cation:H+ antiporter-2, CPA2 family
MSPIIELGVIALGLYVAHWVSGRLGLSSIIGYVVLGLALGPYSPLALYQVTPVTSMLGELGIILLLFYMGLEFSLKRFSETRRQTTVAGLLDLLNYAAGFLVGLALGLGFLASLFLGGIVYISSSGVIAKLLAERNLIAYPEAERTLGVLVFEDLAMIVILGGLGLLVAGGGLTAFAGVGVFLVLYALLLKYGRAPLTRLFSREGEALVLLSLALVVLFSMGAAGLGFPEAVAAFLLGMMIAETPFKDRIETTLHPWYDVAAAVFFLDFALHVNLVSALGQWPAALLLIAVTVLVNTATGFLSGRLSGLSRRASIGHGLMLWPRGEFSLIIVGLAAGVTLIPPATRDALTGMTSLYVLGMVVLGSLVFRHYDRLTDWLAERLKTQAERERDAERARELDAVTLD